MAQSTTPAPCYDAISVATRAVEADSAPALRARLDAELARRPTDQNARLVRAALARQRYDHAAATRDYTALLSSRSPAIRSCAHLGLVGSYLLAAIPDSAGLHARAALQEADASGDRGTQVLALLVASRVVRQQQGIDSAKAMLRRAESLTEARDADLLAQVRCWHAMLVRVTSTARADSIVASGLALAVRDGRRRAAAYCLFVRASVEDYSGRHQSAQATFREAERLARDARDTDLLGTILQARAVSSLQWSASFAEGRRAAEEAFRAAQVSGNRATAAWALLAQAQLALKLGDVVRADSLGRDVERRMLALGLSQGQGAAYDLLGETDWLSRRLPEAYRDFELGARAFDRAGYQSAIARMRRLQAGVLRELGQPGPAAVHLRQAEEVAERSGLDGVLAAVTYERGLAALAAHDWDTAVERLEAFLRGTAADEVHVRYDVHLRLAEAHAGAGRLTAAERHLARADSQLVRWRASVTDRSTRLSLQSGVRLDYDADLGLATVVAALVRGGRVHAALRAVEDRRAQHLWSRMLQRADFAEPDTRDLVLRDAGTATPLDDLPRVLPDSTAVVVYETGVGGEPSTVFIISRRGISAEDLTPGDSLAAPIERFVTLLAAGRPGDALARDLGRRLLTPIARAVGPDVSRLVVVPDGPLHRLPFDALALDDGRLVVERFAISVAPSARIARSWWTGRPRPAGRGALVFADPAIGADADLVRLAGAAREADDVRRRVGGARVITGTAASEAALKRIPLSGLGVLHFATHARVQDFGLLESALFLAPGNGEDGRVTGPELAALRMDVDLVVLSACQTAGGPIMAGEGVQGLTAPLLEAGARAVAATYWDVGDRSLGPLVREFYEGMTRGRSAGDALRAAKQSVRVRGAGPEIWAAFALVGDPMVRPDLNTSQRSALTAP